MKHWQWLLCLAALLALAGCDSGDGQGCNRDGGTALSGSSWPKFRRDLANTGQIEATIAATQRERWVFPPRDQAPFANAVTSPVILADKSVLIVGGQVNFPSVHRAYLINPDDGTESSHFDISLTSTAGVSPGTTPVLTSGDAARGLLPRIGIMFTDGSVRQFEPDGTFVASLAASGTVTGSLTVDFEGTIYTATNNGVYSSLCASGGARWLLGIGASEATAALFEGDPLTDKDDVSVIGSNDGRVRAFNFDARQLWSFTATDAVRASTIYDADNGLVYGVDLSGQVFVLNAEDGRRCRNLGFNVGAPVIASPAYGANTRRSDGSQEDILYVVDTNGILHALAITAPCDPASATPPAQLERRWTYDSGASVSSSPALASSPDGNPVIVFGTDDGTVHAVEDLGETGTALWTHCTGERAAVGRSSVAVDQESGTVFVSTTANRLYAISAGDGISLPCSAIENPTATASPSASPSPTASPSASPSPAASPQL
jgi:outer membrane protein assembly factor BamB